ncbi:MAG: SUMF1/EgtB/PvdO family nonheme iron enzyme [Caldilineales bacterium]
MCCRDLSHRCQSYGAEDMTGNIWEWCRTAKRRNNDYNAYCEDASTEGTDRALYAGAFSSYQNDVRSAYRGADFPDDWSKVIGFRVVASQQNTRTRTALQLGLSRQNDQNMTDANRNRNPPVKLSAYVFRGATQRRWLRLIARRWIGIYGQPRVSRQRKEQHTSDPLQSLPERWLPAQQK